MLKSKLIEQIAKKQHTLTVQQIAKGVNTILEAMTLTLSHKHRIEIRGFGSFSIHHLAPRKAHNPKTGKRLVAKEQFRPHFKPGKELRRRVNIKLAGKKTRRA